MMDELRDYRFYAADMLHPSEQAITHIWQRFSEAAFDEETKKIMHEVEKITAAQQHRPHHENTTAHRKFLTDLDRQIQAFSARYPFVELSPR
jgi:cytochrome c556